MAYLDSGNRDGRPARGQHNPFMNQDIRQPARILIVDDDPRLRETVFGYLEENNIHAVSVAGRQEMTRHVADNEPSLVILDLRLGKEDGLDLLREIRSHSDVPVIITTGDRYDEIDRVVGLELGADDYLTEPFGLRELLARIRAVLRRRESAPPPVEDTADPKRGRYRFGGWVLNRSTRRLTDPQGAPVVADQGRIRHAAGLSRSAPAASQPRIPAAGHPRP